MKSMLHALGLAAILLSTGCGRSGGEAPRLAAAARGPIRMTVPFQGELEARRVEMITVGIQGSAVLAALDDAGAGGATAVRLASASGVPVRAVMRVLYWLMKYDFAE